MKLIEMRMNPILNTNIYPVHLNMEHAYVYIHEAYTVLEKSLKEHNQTKINIYSRGSSGTILTSMLWMKLMKNTNITAVAFHYIRKQHEDCHAIHGIRSNLVLHGDDVANIILDDFMSSGETILNIIKESCCKHFHYLILSFCEGYMINLLNDRNIKLDYIITRNGHVQEFEDTEVSPTGLNQYEGVIEYEYTEAELRELNEV